MTGSDDGRGAPVALGPGDREQPAGRVFALVLADLLAEVRRHEPAVLAGDDVEALHDYRVGLRRARSLLAAGRDVYPPEELELLRALTAELAAATSPVRDLDVLLQSYDELAEHVPPALGDGSERLRAELARRREDAHGELVAKIRSDAHQVLLRRWYVLGSVHRIGGSDPGPAALRPTGPIVDDLICRAYQRALRRGDRLIASDDPADWHRLRRRLKRLRYLVAAFAALYPEGSLDPLQKELRKLQDRFGALQDDVAGGELVTRVGAELGGDAALAAGAVAGELHRRTREDLRRCRDRWPRLGRKKVRRALEQALAGAPEGAAAPCSSAG